jgi:uncharacterized protein YbaR (Trm112 family)
MIEMVRKLIERTSAKFVRRFFGRTFACPVCHLVLAAVDANGNGLLVCPVCGAVLEIENVYGHIVPVVLDMELQRPQPTARLHPLATHLPIGLFPFALLGAAVLFLVSLAPNALALGRVASLVHRAPLLADTVLVLLVLSVGFALTTLASGLWDWVYRYRQRPYWQIRLKIAFSIAFLALGGIAIALHAAGLVFIAGSGLMALGSPLGLTLGLLYLGALSAAMVVLATLGHLGGTLVFGR